MPEKVFANDSFINEEVISEDSQFLKEVETIDQKTEDSAEIPIPMKVIEIQISNEILFQQHLLSIF